MAKPAQPSSRFPLTILTAYADLAQQVETAGEEASVDETEIKGIRYLRLRHGVGATRVIEHLGRADDQAVTARAEAAKAEMRRRDERRKLVSLLKRAMPGPTSELGKVLDAMAFAGLFRAGAVLVGTAAYQCYPPLLGQGLPSSAMMTQDADLATADLALAADGGTEQGRSMEAILKWADPSFTGVMQLDPRALPSRFRAANGFLVDLIAPQRRRTDPNPLPLPKLRAGAVPLQYLDWLIAEPVPAVALHGAGVPVLVPQPARFAVHKLILAQKRDAGSTIKRGKDLVQAKALIGALEVQAPYDLADALREAMAKGRSGWAEPICRSLSEIGRDLSELT
jgi:hypothetical protein